MKCSINGCDREAEYILALKCDFGYCKHHWEDRFYGIGEDKVEYPSGIKGELINIRETLDVELTVYKDGKKVEY